MSCPICTENFDTDQRCPKVLPCGHSLCQACLHNLPRGSGDATQINCPECRTVAATADVKTNFALKNAVEAEEPDSHILRNWLHLLLSVLDKNDSSNAPLNILMIGNPGVGKSTFLNALMGEVAFKSGVSYGSGMTFQFDKHKKGIHTYMDTPGLADVSMRKQAAEAITTALKQGGTFKVFFVLTIESGRLRPQDKATIELVLESAPIGEKYGLIINKVSKKVHKDLQDEVNLDMLLRELRDGLSHPPPAKHIHVVPKIEDLEDADDQLVPLPDHVVSFIDSLPSVVIKNEDVREIMQDKIDALSEKFETMMSDFAKVRMELVEERREKERLFRQLEDKDKEREEEMRQNERVCRQLADKEKKREEEMRLNERLRRQLADKEKKQEEEMRQNERLRRQLADKEKEQEEENERVRRQLEDKDKQQEEQNERVRRLLADKEKEREEENERVRRQLKDKDKQQEEQNERVRRQLADKEKELTRRERSMLPVNMGRSLSANEGPQSPPTSSTRVGADLQRQSERNELIDLQSRVAQSLESSSSSSKKRCVLM